MASLRKASAYSKKKVRPYTRKSSKRKKAFIKTVPQNRIVKYNMGNQAGNVKGDHKFKVSIVAEEKIQIRDNALESCRTSINKAMDKQAPGNYFFTVKVYPHHILRENKIAAGAGADRLSSGMRHSFGVTMGRAAIVNKGKELFVITCTNENVARTAKSVLTKVKPKIPCKNRIVFEKLE